MNNKMKSGASVRARWLSLLSAGMLAAAVAPLSVQAAESCIVQGSTARPCAASRTPVCHDFDSWAWSEAWQVFPVFRFLPVRGIRLILR